MTKDEALRMALDALESFVQPDSCEHGFWWEDCPNDTCEKVKDMKTITAIKEALAQPEHHTLTSRVNDVRFHKERDEQRAEAMKMLAQPEQEPVATVTSESGNLDVSMSWWHEPALPVGTRLYTTPPQRKPLTDEELKKIWYDMKNIMGWYSFQEIARAIEAAHGIKDEA